MDKQYNHQIHEEPIYKLWEKHESFVPKDDPNAQTFTIIMPPPNANDPLHIGHAMFVALEDILIRYHRMKGSSALWLPGTDHAGIETQFVFEKKLAKKNLSRFDFDRETLFKMIWDYVQENSDVAVNQLKALGASADWSRFTFMLEPKIVDTVLETFQKLSQKDLVYRDVKLVNYCTFCGTAFSSLETDHEERVSPFFTIKYGPFEIGTVRPETKFRDTALAVNPNDPRYKDSIGKTFEIMGLLGPVQMTVIPDENVDPEFGTGIMKVTPAHDPHDFELGQIHNLPVTPIIDFQGRMDFSWFIDNPENKDSKFLERAQKYHGLKVAAMREAMKEDLEADGLLVNYNPKYTHNLSVCYRCKRPLEPLPLPQFFVKVAPLVEPVLDALNKNKLKVIGSGHDKILKNWLENLKDWNISRQIVWGIRMPVWYPISDELEVMFINSDKKQVRGLFGDLKNKYKIEDIKSGLQTLRAPLNSQYIISVESPGDNYLQETDTFDTWFSSAQWPFSTLKNNPNDLDRFYPTQVMETGYDILPFWVMRMLMMGKFATGEFPFETIYLHGLIRDQKGQKMSKSKGNVINPLTIIEKYGADALRMALVIRSTPGLDKNVGEADFKAMRNLTNKIWNATRFIMLNINSKDHQKDSKKDQEFYDYLNKVILAMNENLDNYRIGLASETIYSEFWHWFCDTQIEAHKAGIISTLALITGLITFLKLLHPFVPFITETLYQNLKATLKDKKEFAHLIEDQVLITSAWPTIVANG